MAALIVVYAVLFYNSGSTSNAMQFLSIEEVRVNKFKRDWNNSSITSPNNPGIQVIEDFDIRKLQEFIDWTPFFRSWELHGKYPAILADEVVGEQATSLFKDAQVLLQRILKEKLLKATAVYGLFPANTVNDDDIGISYQNASEEKKMVFRTLRQQLKKYKGKPVVNQVSVDVEQGEIVGLLGPNGAGKTTTFYMIVGLIKPNQGKIYLEDQDITSLPMYKRAKKGIGYLAQEASVFRKLTVEDNLLAVLEMTQLNKAQQKEKMESLLAEFGLNHVRKNIGQVLSGGERRRTEIARALAVDPKFVLLDEPFAGVDPIAVEEIQTIVAQLKNKNIGVLITDHNVHETLSITDRAYLMFEGKLLKSGRAEERAEDEQVRKG
jgi:lipopolysaccharide export system ATP-binding protein